MLDDARSLPHPAPPVSRSSGTPPLFAVALVSAAALAYEVLLTRIFSIVLWHHFAYMIISVALLGYGAAGSVVSALRAPLERRYDLAFVVAAALFGSTALFCGLAAQHVGFNPLELAWTGRQLARLAAAYALLALPFFFAAVCVCLTLTRFGAEIPRVYSFDILGGACGSLGIVAALFALAPGQALALVAGTGGAAAAAGAFRLGRPRLGAALLALVIAGAAGLPDGLTRLKLSDYKPLAQALDVQGAHLDFETSSPLGLVSVVENSVVPLRHAPGLSLNAPQGPPFQLAVFIDGDGPHAIDRFDGGRESLEYLDFVTWALPYHLVVRPAVLVLGAGTGTDLLQAHYHGARSVDAVELNPQVVELVERRYAEFSGRPYHLSGVRLHLAEARSFVARDRNHYDLIQLTLLDAFGASSAGLHALAESYLYTVEALEAYLARLRPGGLLAITRWATVPPRDALKLFATAVVGLERAGVADPGRRLAMVRGWRTVTLLVKNGSFSAEEVERIRAFCRTRSFDPVYFPGMERTEANRYTVLPQPWYYEGAQALLSPDRDAYLARYKFAIAPATDDRPYFFNSFKWRSAPEFLTLRRQGALPPIDWGYPVLVATLLQALLASAVLILLPLKFLRPGPVSARAAPAWRIATYFAAVGLAFMLMEIAFIQKLTLFLSYPLYAVAVALAGFLLFAGLGSRFAARYTREPGRRPDPLWRAVLLLCAGAALALLALPLLTDHGIGLPDPARIALALALIAPIAFPMGMPFPLGLARVSQHWGHWVPWAWAINGCASVVGAVAASLLAVHAGFTVVVLAALTLYLLAAASLPRRS